MILQLFLFLKQNFLHLLSYPLQPLYFLQ
jgi:hypothetical protein